MEAVFHPEALDEYAEGVRHYAAIQTPLGQRFRNAVETAIDNCIERPLSHAIIEQDVRRCVIIRRFPYAVLYTIEPGYVLIVAVMHCHRAPGYWRHRIQPES